MALTLKSAFPPQDKSSKVLSLGAWVQMDASVRLSTRKRQYVPRMASLTVYGADQSQKAPSRTTF